MSSPLKIYTDPRVQRPHLPLAPALQGMFRDWSQLAGRTSWEQRFVDWWEVAPQHFTAVPLADAEVAILPFDWYWVRGASWRTLVDRGLLRRARQFADEVRGMGKPLVIFFSGDRSHEALPLDAAFVVREAQYRSRAGARDLVMPGFAEDLVPFFLGDRLPLREWQPEPMVGFCGLAARRESWKEKVKLALYHSRMLATQGWADVSPYKGESLRIEALERLARAPGLRTNFVVRAESVFFRNADVQGLMPARREYVQNLVDSDYVLCCRGSGNYSFRLYETLCVGRIPIFIDTDSMLPCEGEIDWRRSCVWLDETEIEEVGERVRAFHQSLGPAGFRNLQIENRDTWLRHLAPRAFFSNLGSLLR